MKLALQQSKPCGLRAAVHHLTLKHHATSVVLDADPCRKLKQELHGEND
jgi:hypothetical protein